MSDRTALRFLEHLHHEGFDVLLLFRRVADAHERFAHPVEAVVQERFHLVHRRELVFRVVDLRVAQVLVAERPERYVGREEVGSVLRAVLRMKAVVQQRSAVADAVADEPGFRRWNTGMPAQVFEERRVERLLSEPLGGGLRSLEQRVQATVMPGVHRAHLREERSLLLERLPENTGNGVDAAEPGAVDDLL